MIRKFQRQDLEAAVKIWLAANKEAHDFIDPCYWEGYKDAVKEMFLQAEIYVFETEDMMEEIFDETGGILGFIGLDKDYVEGIFVRGDVRSQSIGKQLLDFVKQKRKRLELNYICLFDYLFISSQMSAKPYFIGSTGILLLW